MFKLVEFLVDINTIVRLDRALVEEDSKNRSDDNQDSNEDREEDSSSFDFSNWLLIFHVFLYL